MRLDKYLKTARLLKRRTVSKELADNGRVLINGRTAKPASEVRPGDLIEIGFGYRHLTVRVLQVADKVAKGDADTLYEVVAQRDETPDIEKNL